MTHVKDIDNSANPPEKEDWVLIEKVDGKFVADGTVSAMDGPAYFQPEPFDTLDDAVTASLVWASEQFVRPTVLRDGGALFLRFMALVALR
ncbi:hypothetical protein HQ945_05175 [Phyllobacterium sp. BT25]|uniref:Uncharacterized protein n=1 Tax=Phyllobacterium pellucidum TaxID=2740464 RepID=A0A849VPF7_9HYPH|nr:hypothetical protein [Phyllobacterium pellucidum]NTS30639.1 hypothetical protein [Phyllobacterium pellucidum]